MVALILLFNVITEFAVFDIGSIRPKFLLLQLMRWFVSKITEEGIPAGCSSLEIINFNRSEFCD